jgi:tricorn protease
MICSFSLRVSYRWGVRFMAEAGYYQDPTIHRETVVFVCEDDLWTVPASGGVARRLTSNPGRVSAPALPPDGELLAFAGRDEGEDEVYVMPAAGGEARRLTYLGAGTRVVGWRRDGASVLFSSDAGQPFRRTSLLYEVPASGGEPSRLPTGPAASVSYGGDGGAVIGRNTADIARWKRYRGGTAGELWIDAAGDGGWRRLIQVDGNVAVPLWIGDRVYFVSDHEGTGNLYSCTPGGDGLRRHTDHDDYYARHPATDGRRVVYHAGADLYLFDPERDEAHRVDVELNSPRAQRKRRFVEAAKNLQDHEELHPKGHSLAVTARGKVFTMGLWEGAATPLDGAEGARRRLAAWLHDGRLLAVASDATGEYALEIHAAPIGDAVAEDPSPQRIEGPEVGRPVSLLASPTEDRLALVNHRHELVMVDPSAGTLSVVDRSRYGTIRGVAWSPDGRWLAYGFQKSHRTSVIKLCPVASGETFDVTEPVFRDEAPHFDPEGRYLYFLSRRDFNPVYDNLHFDLGFPKGVRPFLVTLSSDEPSPFAPREGEDARPGSDEDGPREAGTSPGPLRVDLEGISGRVVGFPVPEGRYEKVRGIRGKVLFSSFPVEGSLGLEWFSFGEPPAKGKVEVYDLEERNHETLIEGATDFDVSRDAETLVYRAGDRLRVLKAGEKPGKPEGEEADAPGRKSGWVDLGRVKVSVAPPAEWRQMYREAWRMQRDNFWTADMSGLDWRSVYERYLPLLERVASRSEFSDLMWEMQGELGTSHAYELGGDYRPEPQYHQGFLGAEIRYDPAADAYEVSRVLRGDAWDEKGGSPLARPGLNVAAGDRILAVGGRRVGGGVSPQSLLVNQAESEVRLTVASGGTRTLTVKTLRDERPVRYREWVEGNRRCVHEETGGRVGYVHVPDMGPRGFAEFHRGYLPESERDGLIVDVRYNGGGHVSQVLLRKLAEKRLGYDIERWNEPHPYPELSPAGPLVAITNELAGSDGDTFSHAFKMLGLGPLVGKRTWGGVIGIDPNGRLLDGGLTTQPEYSFWFDDVGYGVENYGTDPTIEVEISPADHAAGRDPSGSSAPSKRSDGSWTNVHRRSTPTSATGPGWRRHLYRNGEADRPLGTRSIRKGRGRGAGVFRSPGAKRPFVGDFVVPKGDVWGADARYLLKSREDTDSKAFSSA